MNGLINGWMDGWIDKWIAGQIDGWKDEETNNTRRRFITHLGCQWVRRISKESDCQLQ